LDNLCRRLNDYDLTKTPDELTLADVMVALCLRPAEVTKLQVNDHRVTGFVKNRGETGASRKFRAVLKNKDRMKALLLWIQNAIFCWYSKDPGKRGATWFNKWFKKNILKDLIPYTLRTFGMNLIPIAHGAKCFSKFSSLIDYGGRHDENSHKSTNIHYGVVDFDSLHPGVNLAIVNNNSVQSDPINDLF
jgi:hypothetical protein